MRLKGGAVGSALALAGVLPASLLVAAGMIVGLLGFVFARRHRRIAAKNLRMCFPERGIFWRTSICLAHFALYGRFVVDHALLLGASPRRFRKIVRICGLEHVPAGEAVIIMVPHMLGMHCGSVRISMDIQVGALFQPQHSAVAEKMVRHARLRLGIGTKLFPIGRGSFREVMAWLRAKKTLLMLPDIDQGARVNSEFVPFLGVPETSTSTALARIARLAAAKVVPCVVVMRRWGGYDVTLGAPWENFPSGDHQQDAHRMNKHLGEAVRDAPAQYYWMHRRFKTRPAGQPYPYA